MRYYNKYLNDRIKLERPYVSELEEHAGQIASYLQSECKFQLLEFIGDECYVCVCIADQKGRFRITDITCYSHSLDSLFGEYTEDNIKQYELSYFENKGVIVYDDYYNTCFPELEAYNTDIATALARVEISHRDGLSTYIIGNFSERISVRYAIQKLVGEIKTIPTSENINLKSKVLFSNAVTSKLIHLSQPGITVLDVIKQRSLEVYVPNDETTKSSCFIDSIQWGQLLSPNYGKCIVGNIECTYLRIGFEIDCFNNLICRVKDSSGHQKRVLIDAPLGGYDLMIETHTQEADTDPQNELDSIHSEESSFTPDFKPDETLPDEASPVTQMYADSTGESIELKPNKFPIKQGEVLSYYDIFGDYLCGTEQVIVQDPYIRLRHQFENFRDLIKTFGRVSEEYQSVGLKKVHLITKLPDKKYVSGDTKVIVDVQMVIANYKQDLERFAKELCNAGIVFTYEFQPRIHDRCLILSNGWHISLGRGLDMFEKPENSLAPKKCKETLIEISLTSDFKTVKPKKRNIKK